MPGSSDEQTAPETAALRVGVDVGGTFTDLVAFDPADGSLRVVKIPSTPPDFHHAVIDAVARVTAAAGGRPADVVHGSTVATNALLQRGGEPVAFVTTEGFRDMLLIGRQDRPKLYALRVDRPAPLTAESNWFTVRERIGAAGDVATPLDGTEVDRLVAEIIARGLRHVAVCLLFSFVNPAHERLIGERCRAAGLTVSLSSEVLPEFREYERASTTVINASLRPRVEQYLTALELGLNAELHTPSPGTPGEGGGEGALAPDRRLPSERKGTLTPTLSRSTGRGSRGICLSIMHSAGGTLSPADAGASAARLVLSGPAGGVMGAAFVARAAGFEDVITYDMGGTSTDVATVVGGQPQWTTGHAIDGLPISLPAFDIHTVGAGGGSVAYLDAGGALRVGPRSAGAVPGPACYGRGGTEPTVTDANVLLGRIVADRFAGGTVSIDAQLARAAIEPLAKTIGKSPEETALGILRVAEDNMAHAVRAVTSRRGLDPRRFTLVSFGGAGGLHACAVAEALEVTRVFVPPYCGVLSALGMVVAPPVADASRTVVHLGDALDDARIAAEYGAVSMETISRIPYEQTAAVEAWADVRFKGQSHELKVRVARPLRDLIADAFRAAYAERFGHVPAGRTVEIVTLRVRRVGRVAPLSLPPLFAAGGAAVDATTVVDPAGRPREVPVLTRAGLADRGETGGPFLLADAEATAFVPAGWSARADAFTGSVVLVQPQPA